MNSDGLILAFSELGSLIINNLGTEELQATFEKANVANRWFTPADCSKALESISKNYLNKEKLDVWISKYDLKWPSKPKVVALVMAGNIPLVGWHDLMCVLLSGNKAQIKFSSKDEALPTYLINKLIELEPEIAERIDIVDKLNDFEVVIATGSNNTARYFEYYFGKYPHIIRNARTSVAVLNGEETDFQFFQLGMDIFSYFGLGCRNVSKLYVPKGYDFIPFLDALQAYKDILTFFKYDNNYTYNKSLLLLNKSHHLDAGFMLLKEDTNLASPTSCLYYEEYKDAGELKAKLALQSQNIQCIVGDISGGIANVEFGKSQSPELWDYADNVDTMTFLIELN